VCAGDINCTVLRESATVVLVLIAILMWMKKIN
jgi:hypothetical protein